MRLVRNPFWTTVSPRWREYLVHTNKKYVFLSLKTKKLPFSDSFYHFTAIWLVPSIFGRDRQSATSCEKQRFCPKKV